jgi:hypothetical protein
MKSLVTEVRLSAVQDIKVTDDSLIVDLADGRTIAIPLAWYPCLYHGTQKERDNWRMIRDGDGIHWLDLDEDISIEHLLIGAPSGESQRSLQKWLGSRAV